MTACRRNALPRSAPQILTAYHLKCHHLMCTLSFLRLLQTGYVSGGSMGAGLSRKPLSFTQAFNWCGRPGIVASQPFWLARPRQLTAQTLSPQRPYGPWSKLLVPPLNKPYNTPLYHPLYISSCLYISS